MACNPQTVIKVAESQIGYLEKKSNADLDSFTGNAGSNNYTKYNRDMREWARSAGINDQWCQNFVDWCFVKAYGLAAAKKLLGGFTNYTPTGSNYFKNRGLYTKRGKGTPQPGDVIYFYSTSKGRIGHVGIVTKVSGAKVYTIEGNTSGASTLVTNGGGVRAKSYSLTSTYIDGYGRPAYASVSPDEGTGNREQGTGSVPALKLGDRILRNGCEGADVKEMQGRLIRLDYSCGPYGADGDFGDMTEMAVRAFQKDMRIGVDGEFGPESLAALIALEDMAAGAIRGDEWVEALPGLACYVRAAPMGRILGALSGGRRLPYMGVTLEGGWLAVEWDGGNACVSAKYARVV